MAAPVPVWHVDEIAVEPVNAAVIAQKLNEIVAAGGTIVQLVALTSIKAAADGRYSRMFVVHTGK